MQISGGVFWSLAVSNTWTVQIAKFPKISHLFNQYDSSSLNLRNSSLVYHKTKDPFWAKICMNTTFQLLLYIMKVKSQED